MKHFTLDTETNNITIHSSAKEAETLPNSERFSNEGALAKLAGGWPAARLVDIWNSLPGETSVKKFKDRATAVSRIWKAIQSLGSVAQAAEETRRFPRRLRFPSPRPPTQHSRKRSYPSPRNRPRLPPLRHSRPTWRPRSLARSRSPPARRRRPLPQPRKMLVHPARVVKPAR